MAQVKDGRKRNRKNGKEKCAKTGSRRSQLAQSYEGRIRPMYECPMYHVRVGPSSWDDHITKKCPYLHKKRRHRYHNQQKSTH